MMVDGKKMVEGRWYRYIGELDSRGKERCCPIGWVDRMMFLFDRRPRKLRHIAYKIYTSRLIHLTFEPLPDDPRIAGFPWCFSIDELEQFEEVEMP